MRALIALLTVAAAPMFASAQGASLPASDQAKAGTPAATQVSKPSAGKKTAATRKAAKQDEVNLTDAELATARKVHVGDIPCELGATVRVARGQREGLFVVSTRHHRFRMHPVESRTGAIRLEDPQRGAVWIQLGSKSMLMSQKLGQRLADECQSPEQASHAEELRKNPLPDLLEAAAAPAPAASAASEPGN